MPEKLQHKNSPSYHTYWTLAEFVIFNINFFTFFSTQQHHINRGENHNCVKNNTKKIKIKFRMSQKEDKSRLTKWIWNEWNFFFTFFFYYSVCSCVVCVHILTTKMWLESEILFCRNMEMRKEWENEENLGVCLFDVFLFNFFELFSLYIYNYFTHILTWNVFLI